MAEAQKLLTGDKYRVWRMDLAEYVRAIDETGDKELLKELNTLAMRSRITRFDALMTETKKEMARLAAKSTAATDKFLTSAYKDFYGHGLFEIGKKAGLKSAVAHVDEKKLEAVLRTPWSGKNYSQRIWTNAAQLEKTIEREIFAAAHRGVAVRDMARIVSQKMNVGMYEATRLVRTELNYVQNQASLESIKDAGLGYYRFSATLDRRTSSVCREHDGHIYPVAQASPGTNMPPLHPHCRSVIAGAITADDKPYGTRIGRGDKGERLYIGADMTYSDFEKLYLQGKPPKKPKKKPKKTSQTGGKGGTIGTGKGVKPATVAVPGTSVPGAVQAQPIPPKPSALKSIAPPPQPSVPMTQEEVDALARYVGVDYKELNKALRSGKPLSADYQEWTDTLDRALDKLPRFSGKLRRGLQFSPDTSDLQLFLAEHAEGRTVTYPAYTSMAAKDYKFKPRGQVQLFVEAAAHGHDIRAYNRAEQEIIYKRGAKFRVLRVKQIGEQYHIWMEEMGDD